MRRASADLKRALQDALGYFSIIPLGRNDAQPPDGYAIVLLPFVGAIIGAIAGGIAVLTSRVAPQPWPALVAFAMVLVLSGAVHVDGFLDCCDALFASVSVQRRLEILKDPRHGTFAVVGMVLLGYFWVAALLGIPPSRLIGALAFSGSLSRLSAAPAFWLFPHAREPQAARSAPTVAEISVYVIVCAGTIVLGALIAPVAMLIVPFAVALSLAITWASSKRLGGGVTGDVYGLAIVVTEVAVLISIGLIPWR